MYRTSSAKAWRYYQNRYRLTGCICVKCKRKDYPVLNVCRNCGNSKLEIYEYKPAAKLITWSEISAAPQGFAEFAPYIVAIVELEKEVCITSQLVDVDNKNLKYGVSLKPVFRKIYADGDQ